MNDEAMKEVLNELFSHLEKLETQNEAILQFLKEKKRVTDKQLAPYLEQAGNASNVRWRAARVRIERMLTPEHPEKEVRLGKQPQLNEDSAGEKRTEAVDKEDKQTEPDGKEQPAPAEPIQARPTDDKEGKSVEKSVPEPKPAAQGERERQSDSVHHPSEVSAPLAEQEGAEPAARLNAKDEDSEKEAA
jgi:hypothetical protein